MYTFFKAAWRNIRQTGSVMESSPVLTSRMTDIIQFQKSLSIVELGAGTGVMTRHLLGRMSPASTLASFEINPDLYRLLSHVKTAVPRIITKMCSVWRLTFRMNPQIISSAASRLPTWIPAPKPSCSSVVTGP